jgi:tRNA threonylcarbamoyladenosine biosynthesis protein TsaE
VEKKEFISKSPSDTWDIGEYIGKQAKPGDLYTLYGELGSGKTQLAKGIARGIGVTDWEYVVSPSFTIMNIYEGGFSLCHVDLYRIESAEVDDLDLEEFLQKGIVVVEWAERGHFWNDDIKVHVENTGEKERKIVIIRPKNDTE